VDVQSFFYTFALALGIEAASFLWNIERSRNV